MATKQKQTTSSPQLESSFGDVEVQDGRELSYESAKIDVLGTQAVLTIAVPGKGDTLVPQRIDRIQKARMSRRGDGVLEYVGESDFLRGEVGTTDVEVRWIMTPKRCVDCGG